LALEFSVIALPHAVRQLLYTITLRNFVVPTRSIWLVILFRETGVVHRIAYSFSYFLLVLFSQFIVDKIKKGVLYQVKQLTHILLK